MNEAKINEIIVMINKTFADEFAKTIHGENQDGTTYMVIPFSHRMTKWIIVQKFDSFGEMENAETFELKWEDGIIEKAQSILEFATK